MMAPHIIKPLPTIVHGQVGEITTLEAKAFGKPMPVTRWLKAGQEIHESEHFLIDNYADGTSILTISNAEPETIDRITFEAASPLGVAETVTELHVEGIFTLRSCMLMQPDAVSNGLLIFVDISAVFFFA